MGMVTEDQVCALCAWRMPIDSRWPKMAQDIAALHVCIRHPETYEAVTGRTSAAGVMLWHDTLLERWQRNGMKSGELGQAWMLVVELASEDPSTILKQIGALIEEE